VNFIVVRVGVPASQVFFWYLDENVRNIALFSTILSILSVFALVVFIIGLGFFSRYVIGRLVINTVEKILSRLPFINTVYRWVKQIVDTFTQQQKTVFQEVVLIQYPRRGVWAVGFRTSETRAEIQAKTGLQLSNIFVPTTPNPTSGFLLLVPSDEVIPLEMSVSDGMKLIISGGAVAPPTRPATPSKKNDSTPSSSPTRRTQPGRDLRRRRRDRHHPRQRPLPAIPLTPQPAPHRGPIPKKSSLPLLPTSTNP